MAPNIVIACFAFAITPIADADVLLTVPNDATFTINAIKPPIIR
eukprot:CAMPEP_0114659694 /NCGR_PEP_ID=MMETSP0191-20121206/18341_1 /TAXON_ID=126664 /ORGANISM="Sorites sp." /LENGTH=43 /DNA_ID= /DNA_START= /DNA_END= /DNA_ORIENTATION=